MSWIKKKGSKLYIHKVLFISKLSLGLVLVSMIVKTAMLPGLLGKVFVPAEGGSAQTNLRPVALPASALGIENINAFAESAPHTAATEDYSAIVRRNIFGDANSATASNKSFSADNTQPADDELGLALVGTIAGSPIASRAIIKDTQTNKLDLYKTGQMVAGACVESIEKDAVILLHNGQRKTLTLKTTVRPADGTDPNHVPLPQTVGQHTQVAELNLQLNHPSSPLRAKIEQVASMLKKAVVEPYVIKGHVEGLKITGLEGISAARDLGLKNGDVIRVVNGQQITSKQRAYQIFKKAKSQVIMDIELLRGSEPQKLSFVLR